MSFEEILDKAIDLLRRRGRVTYRALQRQLELDDGYLEDLKEELIEGQRVAVDEGGKVLVLVGGEDSTSVPSREPSVSESMTTTQTAERRQLTVMFCDLIESTALSGRLDPEDLREVIHAYQTACGEVIEHFGGHIAQYLGDGLLVYFGYPRAHEDDAQRAVRAGLGMLAAMQGLSSRLEERHDVKLAVRIGIHTGIVVVGEIGAEGRQEQLALGETPNVAARVQGLAEPDSVVISFFTYRLTKGYFEFADLGLHRLRGVAEKIQVFRVVGESGAQSRIDAAGITGLTYLVGRTPEIALLTERWEQAKEDRGQVVLLGGEAGVGKSRLVDALLEKVYQETFSKLSLRCSPYYRNTALHPVIEYLEQVLRFTEDDSHEDRAAKLEQALKLYTFSLQEAMPLFCSLLSLPCPAAYEHVSLSPERRKQRTLELLVSWLLEHAHRQPAVSVWEDLHWADPTTLELLGLFVERTPEAHMLSLFTFRPDFRPPWVSRSHLTQIILNRFSRSQVEQMVRALAGGKLPPEVLQQIVDKTDGVPLFVEEVTKLLLESACLVEAGEQYELTGPLDDLAVPATLHDSLMARLDKIPAAKEVAQLAATLGRDFSYDLIAAVSDHTTPELDDSLARLVDAELLFRSGNEPRTKYSFKHALIQDVAYESLLKTTRQEYHKRIVTVLEANFPETQPELLGHHCTRAGLEEQAIPYWQEAGKDALERSAHVEAISHLRAGLALLEELPESPQRTTQEISLQLLLGVPYTATKGYGAEEVEQTYARARDLCQQVGDTEGLSRALYGLWRCHMLRAEYGRARELGTELLALADGTGDESLLISAHRALGATLFYMGELTDCRKHVEEVIATQHGTESLIEDIYDVVDPVVTCRCYAAWALWLQGYADRSSQEIGAALERADDLDHPFSQALALSFASWLHQWRGEHRETRERADAAVALSVLHGFSFWVGWGNVLSGWAQAQEGDAAAAIPRMQEGLAYWRAKGSELGRSFFLTLLAEAYRAAGDAENAFNALSQARDFTGETDERYWESERLRLEGELLLDSPGREKEAESRFRDAFDVARQQQAKSLELRAALSLGRLWQAQGRGEEAHQLLRETCEWFDGGRSNADLSAAAVLLQQLS